MNRNLRFPAAFAAGLALLSTLCTADPKSLSAQTLGARATVTSSATLYGGFALHAGGDVYILVRGSSLGTLGVTQNFLGAPRVHLFNSQGHNMINDSSGAGGFNGCVAGDELGGPVVSFYQDVRGQPVHQRDTCAAVTVPAGVYTFTVRPCTEIECGAPSVPSSGEVLFEVTFAP